MPQENLFRTGQVLLFIGHYPSYFENEVAQLIKELGFSSQLTINGQSVMETKNLYSRYYYFQDQTGGHILEAIKEEIYERCKVLNIGILDFFLIDSTEAPMFKSIWHDGFY